MAQRQRSGQKAPVLGSVLDFLRELWALEHAFERASKRTHAHLGVTAEQRILLRIVGENPGISAGGLTELMRVDAGTTSAALRRLEERGFVTRKRDEIDARRITIDLTSNGRKLVSPRPGTLESAVQHTLAGSSAREMKALRAVLWRLIEALDTEV
jgi:DNA-binding MarR family transcriptional regulator